MDEAGQVAHWQADVQGGVAPLADELQMGVDSASEEQIKLGTSRAEVEWMNDDEQRRRERSRRGWRGAEGMRGGAERASARGMSEQQEAAGVGSGRWNVAKMKFVVKQRQAGPVF